MPDDWTQRAGGLVRWSADAVRLLWFVYQFWFDNRRPPNLQDVHAELGLWHREVRLLYRELQLGFAVVVQDDRVQLNLLKAPPFSATPTPVKLVVDDQFLSYLGCASEAFTIGGLPMLDGVDLEVHSYCGCCYRSLRLTFHGTTMTTAAEDAPVVAIIGNPYSWAHGVPADRVCDDFHFAVDEKHAERFAHVVGRRHVTATCEQMMRLCEPVAVRRMHDPDWPPLWLDADAQVESFERLGVDVNRWRLGRASTSGA